MKEMVYNGIRKVTVLDDSTYIGYHYVILSLGTHPCAYVEIPKESSLYKKDYNTGLSCHGGITYAEWDLHLNDNKLYKGWFIGWDYAHQRDFIKCSNSDRFAYVSLIASRLLLPNKDDKHWTTAEILEDVKNVIEQIIVIDSVSNGE